MSIDTLKATLPTFEIKVQDIVSQLELILKDNLAQIDTLLDAGGPYTWDSLLAPMDECDAVLNRFWGVIEHLNAVMNNDELRAVYEKCLPKLSAYATHISHNRKLYEAIQSIHDRHDFKNLSQAQQKAIENHLRDFKLAGVTLSDDHKAQFAAITQKLSELSNCFENNVLDATHAWSKHIDDESLLTGLPDMAKAQLEQAAKQAGHDTGWLVNLEMPNYFAVMSYAEHRDLRQEVYTAFVTRASDVGPNAGKWDNSPIMQAILEQRLALATLLDFENYAERSLATKMVKDTQQVLDFLNELAAASLPSAQEEFSVLGQFARETLHIDDLQAWDVLYASEKLRIERYDISPDVLRPYFPVTTVLPGLFDITHKLFGIELQPLKEASIWHPDVQVFAVMSDNKPIAAIYFDLYARPKKRGGAWMTDFMVRRRAESGIQLPIAFVTCNFAGPVGDQPALLRHDDVVTLFHEFGHALQHMLTEIEVADVSGINGVPWDAVEVASQFLENWAWQRESLDMISSHIETGESLPNDLFDKMMAAKNFQSAMAMMRQLEFALFDFELHCVFNPEEVSQIQSVLNAVRERVTVVPVPAFNRFQHGFSHIFAGGYAAGYYSYKWAEVMAADAFELFIENGIFDRDTSKKFHSTFLARGGAEEPAELFERFRGRAPRVTALLKQSGITV